VIKETFSGTQPVKSTISVYGVRERTEQGLAGTFVTSSLAMAPFPIPITLKGDFQAYRIDATPRAGLGRLLDLFAGCRRG